MSANSAPRVPAKGNEAETFRTALFVACAIALTLAQLPYVWAILAQPSGTHFAGFITNLDDQYVYLSWMRQAYDGQLFHQNLFNSNPDEGKLFNLYTICGGLLARLIPGEPSFSLPVAAHVLRIALSILLCWLLWRLAAECFSENATRFIAVCLCLFSSGLGWALWAESGQDSPVDTWQPEAITFLSVYSNGLFVASLCLIAASLAGILRAQHTGQIRHAVWGGMWMLILGNIHSYDVLPLYAALGLFGITTGLALTHRPELEGRLRPAYDIRLCLRTTLRQAIVPILISLPSVGYVLWVYVVDPVFQARAQVPTRAPAFYWVLLGLGIPLLMAVAAIPFTMLAKRQGPKLLVVWASSCIFLAYLPVEFARKLLMGVHIPISLLAAFVLVQAEALRTARKAFLAAGICILTTFPTNARYLAREFRLASRGMASTGVHSIYLPEWDYKMLNWLNKNKEGRGALLCHPWTLGIFAPSFAGVPVYAGHWGETTHFTRRQGEVLEFYTVRMSVESKLQFVTENHIGYVAIYESEEFWRALGLRKPDIQSVRDFATRHLKRVHREGPLVLYAVQNAAEQRA